MQNHKNLNQIAAIIAGYTFRTPIKMIPQSSLFILQAKNITEDSLIDESALTQAHVDTSHTKAFVESGDVAIGSRGVFRAGVIQTNKKVLAASSVYLLRIKDKTAVLPEYLAIYLNSASGQKKLSQFLTTGTIKTLLKKDLENICIPIPSVEQQRQIIGLDQTLRAQSKLMKQKAKIQKNILMGIFNQLEGAPR